MKKEFIAAVLDPEYETFIVYVAALSLNLGDKMHFLKKAQIAYLKADKASTKVFSKYADFIDIFSPKLATQFLEHIKINAHTIE